MKRFRVRSTERQYDDDGPDLLRPNDNATRQMGRVLGRARGGWHVRVNPPGKKDDWTDWSKPLTRGEMARRIDAWQPKSNDGAKLAVGRRPKKGADISPKAEMMSVNVREVDLANVSQGAELVADLARAQFPGLGVGGFDCREYNGIPGSGWSDHAWGTAVDLWGPPNDKLMDWCCRMGREGCMGGAAQFIGSRNGRVYSAYNPGYAYNLGGPPSHLTHVHCSYTQHYGRDPHCR